MKNLKHIARVHRGIRYSCVVCGREFWLLRRRGYPAKTCSDACKQKAYRQRLASNAKKENN